MAHGTRRGIGGWGENLARDYLARRGYHLIDQNVRTPYGEIDLIAAEGQVLVFVEVKTRSSGAFGLPEEAITPEKRRHLLEAAQAYLQEHPEHEGDWRIDVIAIQQQGDGPPPQVTHFENAVT